jgi:hypothetical protein
MESKEALSDYYQTTTIGWVCMITEDEFIKEAQEVFEQGYLLRLQATKDPATVDLSRQYILKALAMGDEVLEPVLFLK